MMKNSFVTLKFKLDTAEDFRKFSQELRKQQTETLQLMLDFFRKYHLNPTEDLGPNLKTLEGNINRRINAVIAIIRDIEKTQTKPTFAMLQLLFQHSPARKEVLVEKRNSSENQEKDQPNSLHKKCQVLQCKISKSRKITATILERVKISRSSFGKDQLRLMMTQQEFEAAKQELENL